MYTYVHINKISIAYLDSTKFPNYYDGSEHWFLPKNVLFPWRLDFFNKKNILKRVNLNM